MQRLADKGPIATESRARDATIARVKEVGRRRWKKESGCHQQACVESAFFRYKSILGDRLRARAQEEQETEAVIACNILNRMTALGSHREAKTAWRRFEQIEVPEEIESYEDHVAHVDTIRRRFDEPGRTLEDKRQLLHEPEVEAERAQAVPCHQGRGDFVV